MFSLILAVIYMAFISLGLPDSLLGSAWPVMRLDLGAELSSAGIVTMIISCGTIVSSLFFHKVINRLGTGLVTALSVALTAAALAVFSLASEFWMLCLLAVPYGLGAGAVDAALNNYVALHYSSRQMSWLHAFWGVGVTISPYIMSFCLERLYGWQAGYGTVSVIQWVLTVILFMSLPLWKKNSAKEDSETVQEKSLTIAQTVKLKGAPCVLIAFFGYCALETTAGLWATCYMVESRGIDPNTAASFAALFYIGITVGRVLNGFVADRFGDRRMIRFGIIVIIVGILLTGLPVKSDLPVLCGLIIIGLGAAPIYPCIIHSTPQNFGKANSQALVGIQMASAYFGNTLMPPVFGLIAQHIGIWLYPFYLGIFALLMLVMTEKLNRIKK